MSTSDSSSLSSVPSSFSLMPQRLLPCVQRQSVFSAALANSYQTGGESLEMTLLKRKKSSNL
ncbi:hypothetical protein BDD12DRAFT_893113 [Trichophaea hybrida]|nr:hypothetical protein BDD12DRAFT_893113 [Trichophaea hybrida]